MKSITFSYNSEEDLDNQVAAFLRGRTQDAIIRSTFTTVVYDSAIWYIMNIIYHEQ
jgi:hypothetical protein